MKSDTGCSEWPAENKEWHIKNKDSSDPAERTDLLSGICHRRTESSA